MGRHRRKKASVHIFATQAQEIDDLLKKEAIPQANRDEFVRAAVEAKLATLRQAPPAASEREPGINDRSLVPGNLTSPGALRRETAI